MVLTSPATPSTADNIYIALPEQTNVYLRPQRPTFAANLTNNNAAQLYPNQVELQEKSNIWNKGDYGQKVQYNKEHWRQKTSSGKSDNRVVLKVHLLLQVNSSLQLNIHCLQQLNTEQHHEDIRYLSTFGQLKI